MGETSSRVNDGLLNVTKNALLAIEAAQKRHLSPLWRVVRQDTKPKLGVCYLIVTAKDLGLGMEAEMWSNSLI